MADQATMKTNGPASATASGRLGAVPTAGGGDRDAGPGDVVTNVAEFAEHLLTLAELQTRLATIEMKQNVQAVKFGGAVMLVGAVIGIAGLPIALAGIAEVLVTALGMNRGAALLLVAVAAFAVAGICIVIAAGRLRGSDLGFPMSKEELTRNINWIRTVLLHSGRSSGGRRR
jgi:Putative Actinobacterial Holin-X, holin superfamily III